MNISATEEEICRSAGAQQRGIPRFLSSKESGAAKRPTQPGESEFKCALSLSLSVRDFW